MIFAMGNRKNAIPQVRLIEFISVLLCRWAIAVAALACGSTHSARNAVGKNAACRRHIGQCHRLGGVFVGLGFGHQRAKRGNSRTSNRSAPNGTTSCVWPPRSSRAALKSKTPMQAMKSWYHEHPNLFHKRPYGRPGCDS